MSEGFSGIKKHAIIVAGGSGSRTGLPTPKQFILLAHKPVLMHTVEVFANAIKDVTIVIALPKTHLSEWESLCVKYNFTIPHKTVIGGETRFHSVKNALDSIEPPGIVGIHDAARPLVRKEVILRAYQTAYEKGNAIPVVAMNESIREKVSDFENKSVDRSRFCIVQTPQCFRLDSIKKAFEQPYKSTFTDDAAVLEETGETINLVEGNSENIKITHPQDFLIAEALWKEKIK